MSKLVSEKKKKPAPLFKYNLTPGHFIGIFVMVIIVRKVPRPTIQRFSLKKRVEEIVITFHNKRPTILNSLSD